VPITEIGQEADTAQLDNGLEKVATAISKLKNNKASGLDDI